MILRGGPESSGPPGPFGVSRVKAAWPIFAYNAALTAAAPVVGCGLALSKRGRTQFARLRPKAPAAIQGGIWLQACSVGEVAAAEPVLAALAQRWPGVPRLLSASTDTGYSLAQESQAATAAAWCPLDFRSSVRHFLAQARPRLLILFETELWPNLLHQSHAAGVRIAIINGRISGPAWLRYRRLRPLLSPLLGCVDRACMQDSAHAHRIAALGVPPERIAETGNTKADGALGEHPDAAERNALRKACGLTACSPIVVFGSTRPGDESLAAHCWGMLREKFPQAALVVAPRHPSRASEAAACFDEPVLWRSRVKEGRPPQGERVLLVDTLGELKTIYGLADAAVVCGSFFPGVGGHNPLEPTGLGVATVFGPHMANFRAAADLLIANKGALQCAPEYLAEELTALLGDAALRQSLAGKGRAAIEAHAGAIGRTLDAIAPLVEGEHARTP